jgi:DNA primase
VQNIVAPQGTAFTEQHARILKRYADEVVLCFDSDNAGQTAAVRALDHLLASGVAVRVAVVPAPHDPDSFIKANGGAAFNDLIKNAEGFFDYYLNRLCATNEINSDKGRLAILRAMAEAVHQTGNVVLIDTYAQKTALRLGVAVDAMRKEFSKIKSPTAVPRTEDGPDDSVQADETETPGRPSNLESHLLKLLFLHEELASWVNAHLDVNWLVHPLVRQIVEARLAAHQHKTWHGHTQFLDGYESALSRSLITEAVGEERKIPNPETQLADVTLKLRNQFLDQRLGELMQKIGRPETSDAQKIEFLHEQQQLKRQKRAPLSPLEK